MSPHYPTSKAPCSGTHNIQLAFSLVCVSSLCAKPRKPLCLTGATRVLLNCTLLMCVIAIQPRTWEHPTIRPCKMHFTTTKVHTVKLSYLLPEKTEKMQPDLGGFEKSEGRVWCCVLNSAPSGVIAFYRWPHLNGRGKAVTHFICVVCILMVFEWIFSFTRRNGKVYDSLSPCLLDGSYFLVLDLKI